MKRSIGVLLASCVFLSACNLPGGSPTDQQIATSAALTVQAAIHISPSADPSSGKGGATSTPASSQLVITVEDVTNCRTGPGTNYERVIQILPGQQVQVIGVYPPNYWIVSTSAGSCWVSADFATPMGNVQTVPTVPAPPTPEGGIPDAPTFLKDIGWTYFCYGTGDMEVTFKWRDNADNETGYRVLRNGEVIAELPANSTQFSDGMILLAGQSVTYQIEVYNPLGFARSMAVTLTC
jgi:uncharacterized protein YraI